MFHRPTALIIVPRIGRRKWPIKTKQHGRNMMISVYIYHVWRLGQEDPDAWPMQAPDELEVIKNPKKWPMFRKRKQVSSHAQVIKDFFKSNCACKSYFFVLFCGWLADIVEFGEGQGEGKATYMQKPDHASPFIHHPCLPSRSALQRTTSET